MGIFYKIASSVAKKIMIDTAVNAAVKTVGAVSDYNSKNKRADSELIKVPNSSDHYSGMNYQNVQEELTAYGFTNIALLPKRDLIKGWLTKNGAVEKVSIKGKTEFKEKSKFPADAHIVITYHTFRDSKHEINLHSSPKKEDRLTIRCFNCGVQMAANAKYCLECGTPTARSSDRKKEYSRELNICPYCGEVLKANQDVCHICGFELRE